MNEPTAEQCSAGAQVEVDSRLGIALWWPQMGGYVGKAVAFADDGCLDVLVWHDGNFPFNGTCPGCGDSRVPAEVHVCDPGQWARFARDLMAAAERLQPGGS